VNITSGGTVAGKDFGNYQLGIISGVKFHDVDGNGVLDNGEENLAEWKIYLLDGNMVLLDSAMTTAQGYSFAGLEAGTHEVQFDGSKLSSGVYFYRLTAKPVDSDGIISGYTSVKKMVLMK
jgi:hypothetical protein